MMASKYLDNNLLEEAINDYRWSKRSIHKYEMLIEDINFCLEDFKSESVSKNLKEKLKNLKMEEALIKAKHMPIEDRLARYFYLMAENIIRKPMFQSVEEDDAIQESVIICMEKIEHFDTRKGKAFSYVTQMIFHRFLHIMRNAGVYTRLKQRYLKHLESICDTSINMNNSTPIADYTRN